jgi:hypothetical protein
VSCRAFIFLFVMFSGGGVVVVVVVVFVLLSFRMTYMYISNMHSSFRVACIKFVRINSYFYVASITCVHSYCRLAYICWHTFVFLCGGHSYSFLSGVHSLAHSYVCVLYIRIFVKRKNNSRCKKKCTNHYKFFLIRSYVPPRESTYGAK